MSNPIKVKSSKEYQVAAEMAMDRVRLITQDIHDMKSLSDNDKTNIIFLIARKMLSLAYALSPEVSKEIIEEAINDAKETLEKIKAIQSLVENMTNNVEEDSSGIINESSNETIH